ncbi:carotenoid oxygenase family protein [Kamptonema animale CS-326]|jgi:carotenoid cleavage dioxygenase-like enzyme|uniref:carotenoid oxygenase family protein n=1 Tax=Kamptonema animale TaxID=92934 RepID=UPI00232D65BA|nr:carotenoid oxygenase family protein [Kamptonema animale]MDB9510435.1 carotenoid oxygenase family protein [Kamptonema animale CS-326]
MSTLKTTNQVSTKKAWAKAIINPAKEFPSTQLQVLSGKIPEGLRGTLYRNGPGRLERGGDRAGHWFDGDGAILAVHFREPNATAVYRYVQTAGYQAETAAGKFLYSNYGMTAPGPLWQRWGKPVKNAANTSVLALPDKLLALWEGDNPHALDLETLETRGLDNLGGLDDGLPYSAHCKRDPDTGYIFNFGISAGAQGKLNLYKSDPTGKIVQRTTFLLDGIPAIHDFVMAGPYLVFFVSPLRLNPWPLLAGLSCYSESFEWKPQLGTQILVFDRETLSLVSRGETDPWYQWHFANGWVDSTGSIIIDFVRYPDFVTNQYLKEVASGQTKTFAKATLWQVRLEPQTAKVQQAEEVLNRHCEFPIVSPSEVGQLSRYTYLSVQREGVDISQEMFGAIARFDSHTGTLTCADFGENRYPSEPIYAPDPSDRDRGWILTLVYDGNSDTSEVWIFDSAGIAGEPVCRLALPSVVPMGFHGTWKSAI